MSQLPEGAEVSQDTGHSSQSSGATPEIAGEISDALSELSDLPVERHPEVYEDVHRRLGDTLSGIDHV